MNISSDTVRSNQTYVTTSKHLAYEALVKLWLLRKGKSRWLNLIAYVLKIEPYGYVKGKRIGAYHLLLDPGDANDRLFYFDMLGRGYSALLERVLRSGDRVVDVGANVGHFSAAAALQVGMSGMVHAIEANPTLFERLSRMTSEVPGGPLRVHHSAVWHTAGHVSFNIAVEMSGWSSLMQNETFHTAAVVEVPAVTLDGFAEQQALDSVRFLKLDIEGAETDALLGARHWLSRGQVDYVLVEADRYRLKAFQHTGEELSALMASYGFEPVITIQQDRLVPVIPENRIPGSVSGDWLYERVTLNQKAIFFEKA